MKRNLYIPFLLLLYLLCCAKSCDNREQSDNMHAQAMQTGESDSIRAVYASDTLSDRLSAGLEQTAIQKVFDFSDYLKILNDTTTAQPFREKAEAMIRALFFSREQEEKFRKLSMGQIDPDSVRRILPLQRTNDSTYQGRMQFTFRIPDQPGEKRTTHKRNNGGTVDFYVVKREKHFGKETLRIWTVLLGDIKFF